MKENIVKDIYGNFKNIIRILNDCGGVYGNIYAEVISPIVL